MTSPSQTIRDADREDLAATTLFERSARPVAPTRRHARPPASRYGWLLALVVVALLLAVIDAGLFVYLILARLR
jgi:hypothetical protein